MGFCALGGEEQTGALLLGKTDSMKPDTLSCSTALLSQEAIG
jgi:hypothetical protein